MKKSVSLPKGFEAISFGGQSWKPTKPGDAIIGTYKGFKQVHLEKNGRIPARDVNVHTIDTAEGPRDVWQSGGLKALESVAKGAEICIQFVGKKVIKKGQQPMREYAIGVKPGTGAKRGPKARAK